MPALENLDIQVEEDNLSEFESKVMDVGSARAPLVVFSGHAPWKIVVDFNR